MGRIRRIFRPFVLGNLVVLGLTLWVCRTAAVEWVALYGAALQLIAIGVVLWGLLGTLNVFAPGQLRADAANWVAAFKPVPRRTIVAGMGAVEVGLDGVSAYGSAGLVGVSGTLEQKVELLLHRVDALGVVIAEVRGDLAKESQERARLLAVEEAARTDAMQQLRREVRKVTVADPWLTLFGLICLALGVLVNGAAPLIVALRSAV